MKIIDISQELLSCDVYEGDPVPCGERIVDMDKGEPYNLSVLSMCVHNGTHIDAPLHFFKDGKGIDEMHLKHFVGCCFVAEHNGDLTEEDARVILESSAACGADKRILVKGDVTLTKSGARAFADAGILLIGNEGQSVGPIDSPMEVHKILLSRGVALLEGIVLARVEEGKYFLNCAPLNISGFDGSPCRAILIKEE